MTRLLLILCLAIVGSRAAGAEAPRFNRDIRPILADRCYTCHGPDSGSRKAELRLDNFASATEWAIVPGDADSSEVLARITSDDPDLQMPPRDSKKPPLTAAQVKLLREWIHAGAKYEPHWAYIPPERPDIKNPTPDNQHPAPASWPTNDIDRLLLAKMLPAGAAPSPEADRVTLARRAHFDLTGLPPTPKELDEFLADQSPDAYERLVDKLLASPAFGERMATWWFDLVRFADTVGYHGDQDHRITPYRDYIIKSFNDNLPFDQFTIEQLAGDLLPNPTLWQRIATGYNRVLQTTHEGGAQDAEYRAKMMADRVRNYSEVWLAGSMGCAECHDHKFDPYTLEDHYSLQAFFADVDKFGSFERVADNALPTQRPPEIFAWTLPLYEQIVKLDERIAKLEESLPPVGQAVPDASTAQPATTTPKPGDEFTPLKGDWQRRYARLLRLKHQRLDLEAQFVPTLITVASEPREIRILPRGNWLDTSGKVVEPHVPHFLKQISVATSLRDVPVLGAPPQRSDASSVPGAPPQKNTARLTRLDLARWTVARDNPLAARVVVNRLWKLYFGTGLSKVLIDLGARGEPPPNQELLDWLAVEFMDSGWDTKHMIRLMLTSSAYRQASLPRPELESLDPDNRLVARQARFRLEAEQIRDNALAVSGLLVRKIGGDLVRPYQPAKYYSALNFPEREYQPSTDDGQFRRGVYVHWQRQFLHPWLLAFDAPTREECTAERPISNTPTAALVLLNDPSFVEAARALAARVLKEAPADDAHRVRWVWREVLGREPADEEAALLTTLLEKHRTEFAADAPAAEKLTAVGISPKAATADPPELAAWTSVSRVLLNLNETVTRN